ncbi:MAG TPA: ATP-binding protein [Burkholderiaceae bacterium]|nr:ATP-binding protein [Burkholderiaceae bacterium]
MQPLRISLRYKIPLRVTALVLIVALAVTAAIVLRQVNQARQDLENYSLSLARALANTLQPYLRHDDVWRAYEIVRAAAEDARTPPAQTPFVIVIDAAGAIFVSSRPTEFPVSAKLVGLGSAFESFVGRRAIGATGEPTAIAVPGSDLLFFAAPIKANEVRLGDVVLVASRKALWPHYLEIIKRAAWVTALALAILLPASWFWGRRTGAPLVALAAAMRKVPAQLDDIAVEKLPDTGDEIGELTRTFRLMLDDLKRKRELEEQVIASERLAAIGRLAAGIAHEINNPLGGMLNAVSTYRRHGSEDPLATRTLALLERGLLQIRGSVGALLVETRLGDRALTREDIDDVLLLVAPEVERKRGRLTRELRVDSLPPLPAHQVRQILLNLLLNAAHAIEEGGSIALAVGGGAHGLVIRVQNDGRHIPEEKLQYLFEPFTLAGGEGSGLGLWVVYQIVNRLRGNIAVESRAGRTVFSVTLPSAQDGAAWMKESRDERASAPVSD